MTDDNKKQIEEKKPEGDIEALEQQLADQEVQIAALQEQVEEVTNQWKRALADYQNLEKRTEEQKYDFVQFAIKKFLEKFLGALDDVERAQEHLKDTGLELALKKMNQVLIDEGLERIQTVGKEFDIQSMEAISIVDGEKENIVIKEIRAGYMMHGSVLRPAQVIVSKKK